MGLPHVLDSEQGRKAAVRAVSSPSPLPPVARTSLRLSAKSRRARRYLAGLGYWFLQPQCTEAKLKDKAKDSGFLNGCCIADGEFEPDPFWLK